MVFSLFVLPGKAAQAVDADTIRGKLTYLEGLMPEGTYWNHRGTSYSTYNANREYYNFSSTTTPCSHYSGHCSSQGFTGACGCNSFDYSTQCMGFARMVCTYLFGDTPDGDGDPGNNWSRITFEELRPGDYIRYGTHSVVVSDVDRLNGYVIVAECNGNGTCDISWDRRMYKSNFSGRSPKYLRHAANVGHPHCNSYKDMPAYGSETHRALDFLLLEGLFKGTSETKMDLSGSVSRAQLAIILYRLSDSPSTADLPNPGYGDVHPADWFYKEVAWAATYGVMVGTGSGKFSPGESVTHEMLLTALYRFALEKGAIEASTSTPDLSGLQVSSWAAEAYGWALEEGIVDRVNGTTPLTRAQFAVIVYRYCLLVDGHTQCSKYTDMPAYGTAAHDALDFALEKGLMNGVSATSISPEGSLTRSQLATILYRMAGTPPAEEELTLPYTDVAQTDWFYAAAHWNYSVGLMKGTTATTFSAGVTLDYQTVVTVLFRYAGVQEGEFDASRNLTGLNVASWAADAYRWALDKGLIASVSGSARITRVDFAVVIFRYAQQYGLGR